MSKREIIFQIDANDPGNAANRYLTVQELIDKLSSLPEGWKTLKISYADFSGNQNIQIVTASTTSSIYLENC